MGLAASHSAATMTIKNGQQRLNGNRGRFTASISSDSRAKPKNKMLPKFLTGKPARLIKKTGNSVAAIHTAGAIRTPCKGGNRGENNEIVANPTKPQ